VLTVSARFTAGMNDTDVKALAVLNMARQYARAATELLAVVSLTARRNLQHARRRRRANYARLVRPFAIILQGW
jgi:hypothetical protein